MSSQELAITNLRRELIIHRILSLVYKHPIISDKEYGEKFEQLEQLCAVFPQSAVNTEYYAICPTLTVGYDNSDDYPPELLKEAEHMLHDGA